MILHVAIVSQSKQLDASELAKGSAALQKQVGRDLKRHWNIDGTVDTFPTIQDIPVGYWPILIVDTIAMPNVAGYHNDESGQPFAVVEYSDHWTLATSHEVIEMLIDPFGRTLVAGISLDPTHPGRVQYLVEPCDPCQDPINSYSVNGYLVSDFYTQRYFDPSPSPGVQYSTNGKITKPREILPGGYITWHNLTEGIWYQATNFGEFQIKSLGTLQALGKSLREQVDQLTRSQSQNIFNTKIIDSIAKKESVNRDARASIAVAARIQRAIEALKDQD